MVANVLVNMWSPGYLNISGMERVGSGFQR